MEINKLGRYDLLKHSGAIHISPAINTENTFTESTKITIKASNALTCSQRLISNILYKNAYLDLATAETYTIKVSDLVDVTGFDSRNIKSLKDILNVLNGTQFEFNILGKDKKNTWAVSTILADAEIKKGICTYSYSPTMRKFLVNPNIYARLNLLVQKQFRGGHASVIWEILTEFLCSSGYQEGYTDWLSLEDLKKLLGVNNNVYYQSFKHANQKLIKEPLKEINSVSDINAEPEYQRESRRVIALRFYVSRKDAYQLPLDIDLPPALIKADNKTGSSNRIKLIKQPIKNQELYERLLSFGLTEKQAQETLEAHGEVYIAENLKVVEEKGKTDTIKNIPAYVIKALKEDYRPRKTFIDEEKETKQVANKAEEVKANRIDIIDMLQKEFEMKRIELALADLSEHARDQLKEEFLEQEQKKTESLILEYYNKEGFDHIVVKGPFNGFARKKLIKSPLNLKEFKVFIRSKGYKIKDFQAELKELASVK